MDPSPNGPRCSEHLRCTAAPAAGLALCGPRLTENCHPLTRPALSPYGAPGPHNPPPAPLCRLGLFPAAPSPGSRLPLSLHPYGPWGPAGHNKGSRTSSSLQLCGPCDARAPASPGGGASFRSVGRSRPAMVRCACLLPFFCPVCFCCPRCTPRSVLCRRPGTWPTHGHGWDGTRARFFSKSRWRL